MRGVLIFLAQPISVELGQGHLRTHRSEEHTSELQSQSNLVCRLLLEKKTSTPVVSLPFELGIGAATRHDETPAPPANSAIAAPAPAAVAQTRRDEETTMGQHVGARID